MPTATPSLSARTAGQPIAVEPYEGVVTVALGSTMIASSKRALVLREPGRRPVYYIPFADIYFEHLERTDKRSHSPDKGDAVFWMATANGEAVDPAMWAYEQPVLGMEAIARHGAFTEDGLNVEAGGSRAGHDETTQDKTRTPLG